MRKIVLIACAAKKQSHAARAEELYISPLFKLNLRYAKSLKPDKIFILSAKHHLVELNQELEPYNQTLNEMSVLEIKQWAEQTLQQLQQHTSLENDEFVFLAGEKYRKYLLPKISHFQIPLQGKGIGKQLKFLTEQLK